jgi:hypothetical protein
MLRTTPPPRRATRTWSAPPGPWLAITAAAFATRLALAWWHASSGAAPDAPAAALLETASRFAARSAGGAAPTAAVTWAPVPAIVIALVARAGVPLVLAASLTSAVTGALAAPLVGALGGAVLGSGVGVAAGWLVALDPFLVAAAGGPSAAVTGATAILFALLASVEWIKDPRPARGFGAGLLWGLATLIHPVALPGVGVVAAWAWVPLGLLLEARARRVRVGLLLLGAAAVVAPWAIRVALVHPGGGVPPLVAGGATGPGAMAFLAPALPAPALSLLARVAGRAPLLDAALVVAAWWCVLSALALGGVVTLARSPRRWFLSLPALCVIALGAMTLAGVPGEQSRVAAEPLVVLLAAAAWAALRTRTRAPGAELRVIEGGRRGG